MKYRAVQGSLLEKAGCFFLIFGGFFSKKSLNFSAICGIIEWNIEL